MNRDGKKIKINQDRFDFIKKVARLSQKEVDRCYAMIESAENQEALDAIEFARPQTDKICTE